MRKLILIFGVLVLSGCAKYSEVHACYEKYPSPYGGFGLERITPAYKAAAGADQAAYDRNWDAMIKDCVNHVYGRV